MMLNPMIVKEVRQELRLKTFTHLFVWPQTLLAVAIVSDLLAVAQGGQVQFATWLLWATISLPLLLYWPKRAFSSFAKDNQAAALESLALTRLGAFQIILGKYLSLLLHATLFLVTMVPFVLFHYFVTGVDLIAVIQIVTSLFLVSIFLIAVGLNVSASRKGGVAGNQLGGATVLLLLGYYLIPSYLFGVRKLWTGFTADQFLIVVPMTVIGILGVLSVGATRIASLHEDFAVLKRLLSLSLLGLGALFLLWVPSERFLVIVLVGLFLLPVLLSSLSEPVHPLIEKRLHSLPFVAWFISSGYPIATFFAFGILGLYGYLLFLAQFITLEQLPRIILFACATLVAPWAFVGPLLLRPGQRTYNRYVLLQGLFLAIAALLSIPQLHMQEMASFLPTASLFFYLDTSFTSTYHDKFALIGSSGFIAAAVLQALYGFIRPRRLLER